MWEGVVEISKVLGGPLTLCAIIALGFFNYFYQKSRDKKKDDDKVSTDDSHKFFLSKELETNLWETIERIKILESMHNKLDEDGTPIWYNKKSFSDMIITTLKDLTEIMHKVNNNLEYLKHKRG